VDQAETALYFLLVQLFFLPTKVLQGEHKQPVALLLLPGVRISAHPYRGGVPVI
jgi:hypothetical protein